MSLTPLKLEGSTIDLVPLETGHIDGLCTVGLDPKIWEATVFALRTRAEMATYVEIALTERDAGTGLPFVIIERATDAVVGSTRFHMIAPAHRRLEIGRTWIGLPWQRTRVNTEAKYLLLRHAFDTLRCLRVEFLADSANERSLRALGRIGATQEGIFRGYRASTSRGIRDLAVFSIIDDEWPIVRASLEAKLSTAP